MLAWVGAWVLKVNLDPRIPWLATSAGGFVFWTLAKLLVWILPAAWLIRASGRTLGDIVNVSRWPSWLAWGGGIGPLIALSGLVPKWLEGRPLLPTAFGLPLINVLIVAPLFEELLMRGAVLGNL